MNMHVPQKNFSIDFPLTKNVSPNFLFVDHIERKLGLRFDMQVIICRSLFYIDCNYFSIRFEPGLSSSKNLGNMG